MHKAGQRALMLFNSHLEELGVDVKHYSVLCVLEEGPCSQTELCEVLRVDRTTMVQLIDALESAKLVRRTVNKEDRRAHVVLISEAGRNVLATAERVAERMEEEFLGALGRAERIQLLALLSKLQ